MSFIASLVASGTTALLSGTAAGAMLGAGGTAVLGGVLGGAATGAAMEGIRSGITGTDFNPEGVGIGALTGGVMSGLGAVGNAATAAETGAANTVGQTATTQGVQTVASPVTQIPASGSANAFFNSASNPATQYANLNAPMQSAIGPSTLTSTAAPTSSIFANGQPLSMVGDLGQKYNELGTVGKTLTAGGIGLGTNMALNAATTPSAQDELEKKRMQDQSNFLRLVQNFRPTVPPGYAAGGITDLDGYMSDAQNIPNPQEVADPEGYPSNSMKLMAGGGLASLFPGGQGTADWLAKNSLPGMIFGWQGASDVPLIGGMFNDPNTANLTPEEKKKLMDNMAAAQGKPVQQMAQGGIADLGGYAAGGRPNLLHGPGDGVSDDIPASIGGKQPARLASGEYVIPSRIVSELGNGSTDAGAKRLDMMVQKVNAGRAQTLGGKKYAKDTRAYKHLPV